MRKEQRLLSKEVYKKLCQISGINYDNYILKKLEDTWGRSKGGKLSGGRTKKIQLPKDSSRLAEFYGIMLGDGNLTKIQAYKKGTYQAKIVGDSKLDKDYLIDYVKPLIEKLFKVSVKTGKFKKSNAIHLTITSKELVSFMESKRFKSGDKIRNQLQIPHWIKKNKRYTCACLRGLYDTDGCVYKIPKQNVYQIQFTNFNRKLLKDLRESLIYLGIQPSKMTKWGKVYITKKSELRKFLKLVGFRNSRHFKKIITWNI